MTSDKAIQKSLDNGFTQEEHFKAVDNIEALFTKARFLQTRDDIKNKDKAIKIHEFMADNENSQAFILVKESIDKDYKKIYTLELQELRSGLPFTPAPNEREAKQVSKSLNTSGVSDTPLKTSSDNSTTNTAKAQDTPFKDTKGKDHILTQETQEQWLKTFELENLEQSYIPKHSEEIKQALGGKEIRLQKGSLLKLVSQGREEFIPQIKAVLDEPEAILRDSDNSFLFIKHLKDEDYFVNVSIDKGEYAVSISNGIKESNNLKNKLDSGAKVLYQSPNASSNLQTLLQTSRYSANKIDNADSTTTPPKTQVSQQAPTRVNPQEILQSLSPKQIKEQIEKWDLSNPSQKDKIIVGKVEGEELKQLESEFDFKGNYPIAREIDAQHLAHALNRHSDEATESARNQIPITKDDIANYEQIIKTSDTREVKGKKITYKKQINGHYVVVEEVLTGKNKLKFKTMWKSKGDITPPPTPSAKGYDLDRTLSGRYDGLDSTTKSFNTTKYAEIPKNRFSLETYLNKIELDSIKMDTILKQHPQYTHQELQEIIKHSYVDKSINADKELELMVIKKSGEEEDILYILNLERIGKPYQYEITKLRAYEIGNDEARMQNAKNLFVQARQAYLQGKDEQSQELLETLKTKYLIEFSSTDFKDFTYSFPPILQTQGQKSIKELRASLKEALKDVLNKDITNKQTGMTGKIAVNEMNKISSSKAVEKSKANGFSRDEHFEAAKHIESLFGSANLREKHADYKNRPNIAQVYRFERPLVIDNKEAIAKITLFEKKEGDNKIYTIELESLEKPTPLTPSAKSAEVADNAQSVEATHTEPTTIAKSDKDNSTTNTQTPQTLTKLAQSIKNLRETTTIPNLKDIKLATYQAKHILQELQSLKGIEYAELYKLFKDKLYDSFTSFEKYYANNPMGREFYTTLWQIKNGKAHNQAIEWIEKNYNFRFSTNKEQAKREAETLLANTLQNVVDGFSDVQANGWRGTTKDFIDQLATKQQPLLQKLHEVQKELETIPPFNDAVLKNEGLDTFRKILYNNSGLYYLIKTLRQSGEAITEWGSEATQKVRETIEKFYNIKPIADFGTNYAEGYHDGAFSIQKLLTEAKDYEARKEAGKLTQAEIEQGAYKGQVAGAFYKEGLGDIDLVWGNENLGLQKIIDKHLDDFKVWGEGEAGLIKGLDDIVENGKVISENDVDTIWLKKNDEYYLVGLSKGYNGVGDNKWVITSYKKTKGKIPDEKRQHRELVRL